MTPNHAISHLFTVGDFSRVRTTNRGQLEQTLKELRRLGRIEKIHAAAVQALRSMAAALDARPGRTRRCGGSTGRRSGS